MIANAKATSKTGPLRKTARNRDHKLRDDFLGYLVNSASATIMRMAARTKRPATTRKVLSAPCEVLFREPLCCRLLFLRLLGVQLL